MNAIDLIRIRHQANILPVDYTVPEHNPTSLYIGCIEAPFDSIRDLGLPKGEALIHRTMGAEISGISQGVAADISEAASVEFAVKGKNVQRLIVGMHESCSGCEHGEEKDVLRQNMERLLTYDFVRERVDAGSLEIVGWLGNPVNRRIAQTSLGTQELTFRDVPPREIHYSPAMMPPLPSDPEIYYKGCIDARLDPRGDIGLPEGTIIDRGIGAMFFGVDAEGKPYRPAEARNLRYSIERGVRDIVVAGHTCCGGMDACVKGVDEKALPHINAYLKSAEGIRTGILAHTHDHDAARQQLEQEVVRKSLKNLLTYDFVKEAVENKTLRLHGWVLSTGTDRISELQLSSSADIDSAVFKPMGDRPRGGR